MPAASSGAPCVSAPPPLDSALLAGRVRASHPSLIQPQPTTSPLLLISLSAREKKMPPSSNLSSIPASKVTSVSLPQGLNSHTPAPLGLTGAAAKPRHLPTGGPRSPIGIDHLSLAAAECQTSSQEPPPPLAPSLSTPQSLQETNA